MSAVTEQSPFANLVNSNYGTPAEKIVPFNQATGTKTITVNPPSSPLIIATRRIAKEALCELGVVLVSTVVCCFFIASLEGMLLLAASAITVVAINIIIRTIREYCVYKVVSPDQTQGNKKVYRIVANICSGLCASEFASFDLSTRATLVHEGGHALSATLLFKNANASVTLTPPSGGFTQYSTGVLSSLGEKVGKNAAKAIVAAAGSVFGIGLSCIDIVIAHIFKDKYPKVSMYLNSAAFLNTLNTAMYALSAYVMTNMTGHDFAALFRLAGIHPISAAVVAIAVPVLLKVTLIGIDQIKDYIRKNRSTQPLNSVVIET